VSSLSALRVVRLSDGDKTVPRPWKLGIAIQTTGMGIALSIWSSRPAPFLRIFTDREWRSSDSLTVNC
jgi:hypothetical protein